MRNKVLVLVLALLIIASASSFAIGIGGAFSFDPIGSSPYYGGALSLKLDDLPLLGISGYASNGTFAIGGTADWWMVNENITGILNYYAGLGAYANLAIGDSTAFGLGARVPLGINAFIIDPLEVFLEFAPAVGINLGGGDFFNWGLQGAVGFRFWF